MVTKKFENKKLNKEDHAKVDRDAEVARKAVGVGGIGGLLVGVVIKIVPWKKVGGAISKVIFKD